MAPYLASRSVTLGFGVDDVAPGSAQRSTSLVTIPAAVLADLALLAEVLDSTSSDIAETLTGLVSEVARSLPSFIGLSLLVGDPEHLVHVTTIEDAEQTTRIRTSLRFPLRHETEPGLVAGASGVLIVYAAQPGALVDLAADITWLTGRPFGDARLDEDLGGPDATSRDRSLSRLSTVNQALGVLIGGGLRQEEAGDELDARAARTGLARHLAAAEVLASLSGPDGGLRSDGL